MITRQHFGTFFGRETITPLYWRCQAAGGEALGNGPVTVYSAILLSADVGKEPGKAEGVGDPLAGKIGREMDTYGGCSGLIF